MTYFAVTPTPGGVCGRGHRHHRKTQTALPTGDTPVKTKTEILDAKGGKSLAFAPPLAIRRTQGSLTAMAISTKPMKTYIIRGYLRPKVHPTYFFVISFET